MIHFYFCILFGFFYHHKLGWNWEKKVMRLKETKLEFKLFVYFNFDKLFVDFSDTATLWFFDVSAEIKPKNYGFVTQKSISN